LSDITPLGARSVDPVRELLLERAATWSDVSLVLLAIVFALCFVIRKNWRDLEKERALRQAKSEEHAARLVAENETVTAALIQNTAAMTKLATIIENWRQH